MGRPSKWSPEFKEEVVRIQIGAASRRSRTSSSNAGHSRPETRPGSPPELDRELLQPAAQTLKPRHAQPRRVRTTLLGGQRDRVAAKKRQRKRGNLTPVNEWSVLRRDVGSRPWLRRPNDA